jgi:hypothetical protein
VTAVSASDAWAVGYTGRAPSSNGGSAGRCRLLHWDGTSWSQVTGALPANGCPSAITKSGHDGWAAGQSLINRTEPLQESGSLEIEGHVDGGSQRGLLWRQQVPDPLAESRFRDRDYIVAVHHRIVAESVGSPDRDLDG